MKKYKLFKWVNKVLTENYIKANPSPDNYFVITESNSDNVILSKTFTNIISKEDYFHSSSRNDLTVSLLKPIC